MSPLDGAVPRFSDPRRQFAADVIDGLARPRKAIPAKYLYDDAGSALFDRICDTPEYYPTRTEEGILRAHAGALAALPGADATLVEFGSGASRKTRILLDAMARLRCYVPIDVAENFLAQTAAALDRAYPRLRIAPVCADYMALAALPPSATAARPALGFFPGSTIGNLTPNEAVQFLRGAGAMLGAGAHFIIGVDTVKDDATLHAAYNDAQGITAQFSLNLLARINRELGGDFALDGFAHVAFFNRPASRIEIYLESLRRQTVHIGGRAFAFAAGERIHTEYSYKYAIGAFQRLAETGGWRAKSALSDANGLFSVHVLERVD